MNIRIENKTKNKKVEWNLLEDSVKLALDYVNDYIYIYKWNEDKLKIEVVR